MTYKTVSRFMAGVLLAGFSAYGDGVQFSGTAGQDWLDVRNWGGSYPSETDYAILNQTASLTGPAPNGLMAIRIGAKGEGVLNVGPGAVLEVFTNPSWDCHVGSEKDGQGPKGGNGTLNMTGGQVSLNYLEVGRGAESRGLVNLTGGALLIARGKGGYSIYLGTDDSQSVGGGEGTLQVSGGSLLTRTAVLVGQPEGKGIGTFCVEGSGASQIGIGSHAGEDGGLVVNPGSTLKVRIDEGGITKIFVDSVDGPAKAVFEAGSVLDVDFNAAVPEGGTWVVLEVENGDIENKGLQFSPQGDSGRWSFKVDNSGENGVLTVTAMPTALGLING